MIPRATPAWDLKALVTEVGHSKVLGQSLKASAKPTKELARWIVGQCLARTPLHLADGSALAILIGTGKLGIYSRNLNRNVRRDGAKYA